MKSLKTKHFKYCYHHHGTIMASQKDSVYTYTLRKIVSLFQFNWIILIATAVRIKVFVYETILSCSLKLSMHTQIYLNDICMMKFRSWDSTELRKKNDFFFFIEGFFLQIFIKRCERLLFNKIVVKKRLVSIRINKN